MLIISWVDIISKGTGIDPANISVVAYQKNSFQDKASSNILSKASFWVQIVLAAAILGILVLVIIRSARTSYSWKKKNQSFLLRKCLLLRERTSHQLTILTYRRSQRRERQSRSSWTRIQKLLHCYCVTGLMKIGINDLIWE